MMLPVAGAAPCRSASETRRLALKLQRRRVPGLTKKQLETRWGAGPDSVRKALRLEGVDPGLEKDSLLPFPDGLLSEGVDASNTTWFTATDKETDKELVVLKVDLRNEDVWSDATTNGVRVPSAIPIVHAG